MPEEPFSNFISKPIAGDWKLKVVDDFGGIPGTLDSWSIEITPKSTAASLLSDKDGDTKIQVEKTADEDIIRFEVGGNEMMTLNSSGKIVPGVHAPGQRLRYKMAVLE